MIPGLSSTRPRQSVPNASIAQMVERKTLNLVVVGSIPTGGAFAGSSPGWASSAHRALGSHQSAALAQLGERQTEDLKVPGSIPGGGTFCIRALQKQSVSVRQPGIEPGSNGWEPSMITTTPQARVFITDPK